MEDINNLPASDIRNIINQKIGMFFGACSIAFINIENKYFLDMVNTLLSIKPEKIDYNAPCRQTLSNTVIPRVQAQLDVTKSRLLSGTDSIMMADGWLNTSNKRKYLVFTLRNKHVHQVFLSFHDYTEEREDAPTVGNNILQAIQHASDLYNTRVVGIVTDNDSKIKAGANNASDILRENENRSLLISTCYSHSGNLLIKTGVDEDFSRDCRNVVNDFSTPKMMSLVFRYGGCKLKNYPDTRFCFIRLTCETIVKSIDAMKIILEQEEYRILISEEVINLIEDEDGRFQRQLWETINWTTPVCKLVNSCQDPNKNVADGTEYWLNLRADMHLGEEEIEERIGRAIHPVGHAANLMHPVYRGERLDDDQKVMAELFLRQHLDEPGGVELDRFFANRDEEYEQGDNINPFCYWSIQELVYPRVAHLCKQIMLMPASTSLLEGLFSQWEYVHNKYRNRLSNTTTGTLIDLYHLAKHLDGELWVNTVKKRKRNYIEMDEYL